MRIPVQPRMLQWAVDRSGRPDVRKRFDRFDEWLAGTAQPTLRQLQEFAHYTYSAVGYFFQAQPPDLNLPIPDFRTMAGHRPEEPSPDLLDTVFLCQQRQEWYARYARSIGDEPLGFVGTLTAQSNIVTAAEAIRAALGLNVSTRRRLPSWEDALRQLIQLADDAGVLVMISGVVASNNTRKLDVEEFRGFALSDRLAPLIFVNGSDTKSAQMFTLAHELAHLWLDQSALSDSIAGRLSSNDVEVWCNRVAAEVLIPLEQFKQDYRPSNKVTREMQRLAGVFKVSTLVVLRRMYDARGITRDQFRKLYDREVVRLVGIMRAKAAGGNYYNTTRSRVSPRFARAVITSTLEGRSTFTEAMRLLNCRKMTTFVELGHHVGVDVGDLKGGEPG